MKTFKPSARGGQEQDTSWEESSKWYNELVGTKGHYYHQQVIVPGVLRLLGLKNGDKILDIGCGQGVLAKALPKEILYTGIDASASLIDEAKKLDKNPNHKYEVADATKPMIFNGGNFSSATAILSIQNMKEPVKALELASMNLKKGGTMAIVLNHPVLRIPRQSGWGTFEESKLQYRWVTKYMSSMEIPFITHLPRGKALHSWSFHHSLSDYFMYFKKNGFVVTNLEEWTSDKESEGKHAKKENRARQEIPLFMAIVLRKE